MNRRSLFGLLTGALALLVIPKMTPIKEVLWVSFYAVVDTAARPSTMTFYQMTKWVPYRASTNWRPTSKLRFTDERQFGYGAIEQFWTSGHIGEWRPAPTFISHRLHMEDT